MADRTVAVVVRDGKEQRERNGGPALLHQQSGPWEVKVFAHAFGALGNWN